LETPTPISSSKHHHLPCLNITAHITEAHHEKNVPESQSLTPKLYLEKDVTKPFLQEKKKIAKV